MASSDRADRIAKLGDALEPLGRKARGMPLPADDWNTLVSAMLALLQIDLDQDEEIGVRLEQGFARADHEHLGQVTLAWLDADLQALVNGQDTGAVTTRQLLATMQRALATMQAEVTRLAEQVDRQQRQSDDARVETIGWTRQLKGFDTRFAGVEALGTSVATVAKEQTALKRNISRVLKLEKTLTDPDGQALDVAGLQGRVKDLEGLRESLTGVDNEPVRMRDLQLEILKLREDLPREGGGGLDGRLAEFETGLRGRLAAEELTRGERLREELDERDRGLRDGLDQRLGIGLTGARDEAVRAARDAVSGVQAGLDERFGSLRGELNERVRAETAAAATRALGDLAPQLSQIVEARLGGLRDQLQADVRARLDAELADGLRGAEDRLGGRVEGVRTEFATLSQGIDARIDAAAGRAGAEADRRAGERVQAEVAGLRDSLRGELDVRVRAGMDAQMAGVREIATRAVADGLGDVQARIDASVAGATRDVDRRIADRVAAQLTAANLDARISAAGDRIAAQMRAEIQTSVANVQASTTRQLDAAVVNLRSEFTRGGTTPVGPVIGRDTRIPGR